MLDKQDQVEIKFYDDPQGTNVIFSDIIQININPEYVTLELGIKDRETLDAKISNRIVLTLPHFMRFTDVCQKSITNFIEQLNLEKEKNESNNR